MKGFVVSTAIVVVSTICAVTFNCLPEVLGSDEKHTVVASKSYRPAAPSALSKAGQKLFEQNNCAVCHSIGAKGGCLAPPLDGVGGYRSGAYMLSRIEKGSKAEHTFESLHPAGELLQHPRLSSSDAHKIVKYLQTIPNLNGGYKIAAHKVNTGAELSSPEQVTQKSIDAGRTAFNKSGCLACHSLGNAGGHFAPRLDGIKDRRDRSFIVDRISGAQLLTESGEYSERGNPMPTANLSAADVQNIVNYLSSLKRFP